MNKQKQQELDADRQRLTLVSDVVRLSKEEVKRLIDGTCCSIHSLTFMLNLIIDCVGLDQEKHLTERKLVKRSPILGRLRRPGKVAL